VSAPILVESGPVRLTGVVDPEVECRMAEVLARDVFGTFSLENKLCLGK